MTSQYQNPSINSPRIVRDADSDIVLSTDDEMVVCDSASGLLRVSLPDATTVPGITVVIKATNAGTTGNPVRVQPAGGSGQNIDGNASIDLTADQEFLIVQSDSSNFRVISQSSGGGSFTNVSARYDFIDGPIGPLITNPSACRSVNVSLTGPGPYSVRIAGYNLDGGSITFGPPPSGRAAATNWNATAGPTTVTLAADPEPDIAESTVTVTDSGGGESGALSIAFIDGNGDYHWLGIWEWSL